MPETTYTRKLLRPQNTNDSMKSEKASDDAKVDIEAREDAESIPPKKTYSQELAVYSGIRKTNASVFTLFMRPFVACLTPVCLWAGLLYGVAITWLVLIATSVAQIFSAPRKSIN